MGRKRSGWKSCKTGRKRWIYQSWAHAQLRWNLGIMKYWFLKWKSSVEHKKEWNEKFEVS